MLLGSVPVHQSWDHMLIALFTACGTVGIPEAPGPSLVLGFSQKGTLALTTLLGHPFFLAQPR